MSSKSKVSIPFCMVEHGGPEFFLIGYVICDVGDPDEADSNWGL